MRAQQARYWCVCRWVGIVPDCNFAFHARGTKFEKQRSLCSNRSYRRNLVLHRTRGIMTSLNIAVAVMRRFVDTSCSADRLLNPDHWHGFDVADIVAVVGVVVGAGDC